MAFVTLITLPQISVNPDDKEGFSLYCDSSANYNEEKDKCDGGDAFSNDIEICVCQGDWCNSSTAVKATFAVVLSAVASALF